MINAGFEKTYPQYLEDKEKQNMEIFKRHGVFYAFGEKQFKEARGPLKNDELYDIGGGAYVPKKNFKTFKEDLGKREKFQGNVYEAIEYELNNHEIQFSPNTEETLKNVYDSLTIYVEGVTLQRIKKVMERVAFKY